MPILKRRLLSITRHQHCLLEMVAQPLPMPQTGPFHKPKILIILQDLTATEAPTKGQRTRTPSEQINRSPSSRAWGSLWRLATCASQEQVVHNGLIPTGMHMAKYPMNYANYQGLALCLIPNSPYDIYEPIFHHFSFGNSKSSFFVVRSNIFVARIPCFSKITHTF